MAVRGDDGRQSVAQEPPGEFLPLGPVAPQEARRVHLQRPAALRELVGEHGSLEHGLGSLRVRDQRRQPCRLDVLAECEQEIGRTGERHLHEDDVEALQGVPARLDLEQRGDRRQLPPQPQVDSGPLAQLFGALGDERLALLVGRQERRDVRGGEENTRAAPGGLFAEGDGFRHRLRAVVSRGDDVAVEVDEPAGGHDPRLAVYARTEAPVAGPPSGRAGSARASV